MNVSHLATSLAVPRSGCSSGPLLFVLAMLAGAAGAEKKFPFLAVGGGRLRRTW